MIRYNIEDQCPCREENMSSNLSYFLLQINGILMNTGHDLRIILDEPSTHVVNISGASLVYQYRVCEINIHFGSVDPIGSEHTIDGQAFPAEVQYLISYTLQVKNIEMIVFRVEKNSDDEICILHLFDMVSSTFFFMLKHTVGYILKLLYSKI